MATIERRTGRDGQLVYRIKIRRKGHPPQTATFAKLSEARKWAQVTEGAVLTDRHFTTPEAKRHTLADLIDRYTRAVLLTDYALALLRQHGRGCLRDVPAVFPIYTSTKRRRLSDA